jgi:eukaryotic-like serine/threonine-protein kinase
MHEGLSTPDRYEVVRRIGAGGMGVVYEAEDRERGQRVALKTIPNPGVEQVYQLKREFRVLADLSHPNLVVLYDLVVGREACFFTMELVDGEDLLAYLWNHVGSLGGGAATNSAHAHTTSANVTARGGGPLGAGRGGIAEARTGRQLAAGTDPGALTGVLAVAPTEDSRAGPTPCDLERLRAVLPQLARGLHALHSAGKIHRDVKPSNVRVTPEGRVVLLDFGLVAELDRRRASYDDGAVVGTVGYMAPEQAAGDAQLTPAADWYALGVVMFHALTGMLPFDGSPARVLLDKQTRAAPSAARFARGLPSDLVELCAELLERDPVDRPSGPAILRRLGIADTDPSLAPMISVSRESSFAGRERELEALMAALAPLERGRPAAVVVRGRSGMGKTTLVARFLDKLVAREALVLRGRCFEREDIPYKAMDGLIDELSDWWLDLTPKEAQSILPRDARLLPTLFPMLGRVPAIADSPRTRLLADPQALRSHAFDALREALQRLCDRRTVVLFLDDMQWVDRDTMTLLADLMRPPDPPGVLLVLSCRADEDSAVQELVKRMDAELTVVDVGPLADEDAARLAAAQLGDIGDETLAGLVREAAGSPFFLMELARYVNAKSSLADVAGRGLDAVLSSRLDALGEDARLISDLVAIAGEPIPRRLIAAASNVTPQELSRQLTHLRGQRVVRTAGARADDTIEPYHDRVRQALVANLPAERRQRLHRSLATALAAQGTAEQLAHHWHGAGDHDRAAVHARRAADEARDRLEFDRAAGWYALALDGDEWTPEERNQLVAKHAEALADAGRPAEAAREYLRAASGSDAPTALELRRRAADQLLQSGYIADGLALTRKVLAEVGMTMPSTPGRRLFSMLWRRAWLRMRGLGYRPRQLTEITQAELTRVDVCEGVAFGLSLVDTYGALDFAARFLSQALQLGERWRVSRAIALETDFVAAVGAQRRAMHLLEKLDKLTKEIGGPAAEAQLHATYGFVDFFVHNQWRQALARLEQAIAIFRPLVGRAGFEIDTVSVFACWARYYSGEIAELSRVVPAMAEAAARGGNLYTGVTLRCAFPVAWLARMEPAEVEANLDAAVAAWSIPGNPFQLQHMVALCSRVDLALYRGEPEAVTPHIEQAWRPMRRSLIDRPAINMLLLRTSLGRHALACAAAAPAGSPRRKQALADARKHARPLRRSRRELVRASAGIIEGAAAELEGKTDQALAIFRATHDVLAAHQTDLFVHPLRDRIGRLVGGDEGAAMIAGTAAWLAAQQVREPDTMLQMLLPGRAR